ncbi:hypothetical protein CAMSH0001_0877 [Campylobacter showae RM3277]|uniref:Uncharacterized protein n=1 Tax=Campylobacter showae RM3277 TaxID=553219 RepID=C6RHQ0_9BACT|nr:hypothetical protein CAMSH0001_0877 [Campylobacter showae RM3277]
MVPDGLNFRSLLSYRFCKRRRLRGFAVKFSRIFINFTRPASQTTDSWDLAA